MKIRVAILDEDKSYLDSFVAMFGNKYLGKLELYTFTDLTIALNNIEARKIDVFLANASIELDVALLPSRCAFAYLVDTVDAETIHGKSAVCKFQRMDIIYKQIENLYADVSQITMRKSKSAGNHKMLLFSSPSGGSGSSVMAVACAKHLAALGKRVLYLNLEKFGTSDVYFRADGIYDFSDLLYAIKIKHVNLNMKLESYVRQDVSGVYFYAPEKNLLDFLEMNAEDLQTLIDSLGSTDAYEYIVIDREFDLDKSSLDICCWADYLIMTVDGENASNNKVKRVIDALHTIEDVKEINILDHTYLIYNMFSNKTGKKLDDIDVEIIGGVPTIVHATTDMIVQSLAEMPMWNRFV